MSTFSTTASDLIVMSWHPPGSDERVPPVHVSMPRPTSVAGKGIFPTPALPGPSRHETGFGYRGMIEWNRLDLTVADATLSCLTPSAEASDTSETDEGSHGKAGPAKRPRVISILVHMCFVR